MTILLCLREKTCPSKHMETINIVSVTLVNRSEKNKSVSAVLILVVLKKKLTHCLKQITVLLLHNCKKKPLCLESE